MRLGPAYRFRAESESKPLTEPELAALRYYSRGLSIPMIGTASHKSPATIREQLRSARLKLGTKNTAHACCEAIRAGLIP